jgi:hypothetical protein
MENKVPKLSSNFRIYGAFILGLLTAIAVRALIILSYVQPTWVRPVWYFAVLGNFVFFYYRYQITEKRKHAIQDHQLIEKLSTDQSLSHEDREVLVYLLSSIKKSPEHLNYLIIFIFSIIAIGLDLLFVYVFPA